ncbi:hypothetical protein L0244_30955, partial [bacterium]|nr:hypothetical protein [bacterium]
MTTSETPQSHDLNFKTILVENSWDAITFAMPKCGQFFQHPPEIVPIREETLKLFFSDSFLRTDAPFLATYKDLAFTFLLEHQHDQYSFSIYQLARYVSHLEEEYERDVIPIVYFPNASSKSKALLKETKSAFMGKRYHYFTYEAVCLKDLWAKKYLGSSNLVARLMLPFMRFSKQDWLEVLDNAITGVLELVSPTEGLRRNKYLDFLTYYFKLDEKEWAVYQDYKKAQNQGEVIDMITTLFEEKGKIKGKVEEGRDTLLWLYAQKLGPMPMEIEQAIRELNDVNRIHDIRARFMEINTWQQLKQYL